MIMTNHSKLFWSLLIQKKSTYQDEMIILARRSYLSFSEYNY